MNHIIQCIFVRDFNNFIVSKHVVGHNKKICVYEYLMNYIVKSLLRIKIIFANLWKTGFLEMHQAMYMHIKNLQTIAEHCKILISEWTNQLLTFNPSV